MGETLEEAFYRVSALEASAQILDLRDSVGRPTLD
jgi:ribulose-5-phosphate 4-epimerase/fuculose-1-phosphate aldolase